MTTRRTFTRDFKLKAVRYANNLAETPIAAIAKEIEVDRQSLWSWTKEVAQKGEAAAFPGSGRRSSGQMQARETTHPPGTVSSYELVRAENQLLRVKLERTIAERDALQGVIDRLFAVDDSVRSLGANGSQERS